MVASARLIPSHAFTRMPWKNGGGVTAEIAAYPEGASLDAFGWRISTAHVARDGTFSNFPGIDRTLVVLSGHGLRLTIHDRPALDVTHESAPLTFAGDVPTHATLLDGPIDDLNVMTRRGLFQHAVERVTFSGMRTTTGAPTEIVYCHTGSITVAGPGSPLTARSGDAVVLNGTRADLRADALAAIVHIMLDRAA